MNSQRTKFTVGLFVVSGIAIITVAAIWLGMSRFLEKGKYYATYFDESVQGLDIDSPVKYRGVHVGRVKSISVAPDSKLVQVVLKIESDLALESDIVAQLKTVGITGSKFVGLDHKKPGEADHSPSLTFSPEFPVVASKPSDISEIIRSIDDVLAQIKSLDLRSISDKTKSTLDSINRIILDTNIKGISAGIQSSLKDLSHILNREKWDVIITAAQDAGKKLNNLMDKANKSLARVDNATAKVEGVLEDKDKAIRSAIEDFSLAMKKTNQLVEKTTFMIKKTDYSFSQLKTRLLVIGRNLEEASGNLNRLTDLLADQPSQLIFGAPPTPRQVESENGKK